MKNKILAFILRLIGALYISIICFPIAIIYLILVYIYILFPISSERINKLMKIISNKIGNIYFYFFNLADKLENET